MSDFENQLDYRVPFEATTDPMAVVDVSSDGWRIHAVNDAFADAFDRSKPTVLGEPLEAVLGFDPAEQVGAHPRRARETYAQLGVTDDERLVRVRPLDQPTDPGRVLVVVSHTLQSGWRPLADAGSPAAEPIRTLAELAGADEASAVCDGAAEILLDAAGFDAVVIHLDEAVHLANVDDAIPEVAPGDETRFLVEHDVPDPRNDVLWGTVVQAPVGDRGVVRVATHADRTLGPDAVRSLDSLCQYLDVVVGRIERTCSMRAERQELAMLNRLLRHSVLNGLNLIRARLDLVEADVAETGRAHYETAYARVDDLLDRVEALREMQTGGESETDAYRLEPLLDERLARARTKYPDASFSVVGSVPDAAIRADDLVPVCLENVLRNAVQHADVDTPEVRVRVAVDEAADVATVRIADNGVGFSDIDQSVFGEGVSGLDGDGHGFGLFLTRKVVEDGYGGAVRAAASDRGGAEIVLEFPLADAPER